MKSPTTYCNHTYIYLLWNYRCTSSCIEPFWLYQQILSFDFNDFSLILFYSFVDWISRSLYGVVSKQNKTGDNKWSALPASMHNPKYLEKSKEHIFFIVTQLVIFLTEFQYPVWVLVVPYNNGRAAPFGDNFLRFSEVILMIKCVLKQTYYGTRKRNVICLQIQISYTCWLWRK